MSQQKPSFLNSPSWSPLTKRYVLVASIILIGLALWRLNDALPLIILSVILAYLFNPVTSFLERRIVRFLPGARNWAIMLTIIGAISLFIIVILVILPVLFNQLEEFGNRLPRLVADLQNGAEAWLSQPIIINNQPITIDGEPLIPLEQLRQLNDGEGVSLAAQLRDLNFVDLVRGSISSITGPAVNVVGGALSFIINAIFLLTLLFYWLKDGGRFVTVVVDFVSPIYRSDARRLIYELGRVWNAYLRGQLLLCSIVGIMVFTAGTVLGVPNAPTLGIISGVMEFIPTLGPLIAIIPAILLALGSVSLTIPGLEGAGFAIVVIIVWVLIQNIQAMLVAPRVMGNRLNLHPIVVIIGVIAGATLAGPLGIIMAAPAIASLRTIGQYIYGKLTDTPPFPTTLPVKSSPPLTLPSFLEPILTRARRWGTLAQRWMSARTQRKPAAEN